MKQTTLYTAHELIHALEIKDFDLYIETDKFFTFFRRVFGSLLKVFH